MRDLDYPELSERCRDALELLQAQVTQQTSKDTLKQRQRLRFQLYKQLSDLAGVQWGVETFEVHGTELHNLVKSVIPDPGK